MRSFVCVVSGACALRVGAGVSQEWEQSMWKEIPHGSQTLWVPFFLHDIHGCFNKGEGDAFTFAGGCAGVPQEWEQSIWKEIPHGSQTLWVPFLLHDTHGCCNKGEGDAFTFAGGKGGNSPLGQEWPQLM